jgi:hypothetical protein
MLTKNLIREKLKNIIMDLAQTQIKKFSRNQMIFTFQIGFVFQCVKAVKLIDVGEFTKPSIVYTSLLVVISLEALFLVINYKKVEEVSFRSKYENLYTDVSTKKGRIAVL